MVLYSGISDMFQYNRADGKTDLTNAYIVLGAGDLVNPCAFVAKYCDVFGLHN
jgi:NAD/NADP transhydrogenase beta subunit